MDSHPPASPWQDLHALVAIIFSALTYLFDFSSNIATVHEYHQLVQVYPSLNDIFIAMVTAMAVAHIANAVIFKAELKKEDQPLKTAYLFPLMQLSRLIQALWRTCSWKGLGKLKEDDRNTLYSMVSVSLETAPQLTLQFLVLSLYYYDVYGQLPQTLLVSIFASFLSGFVNGGLAILAVSYAKTHSSPPSWRVKMVGFITSGLFTTAVLFLQCWIYAVQMIWGYFERYPIVPYIFVEFIVHFILFMILLRRREPSASNALMGTCTAKRLLHCSALSYLSARTGTLQPLTRDSRVNDELGKAVYWYKLLLASAVQLCLPAVILLLSFVGPPHLRWSNVCPTNLSQPDWERDFPCKWYVPSIIVGMLMYCFTIASHIALDNYVNKRATKVCSISIHPDHNSEEPMDIDLKSVVPINHKSPSRHRESQILKSQVAAASSTEVNIINRVHRVLNDGGGDTEIEGLERRSVCQILSTTPEEGEGELEIDQDHPSMYIT